MKPLLLSAFLVLSASASGQERVSLRASHWDSARTSDAAPPASWKMSLASLLAAHSLDVASSWGHIETNPLLAGPNGRFGGQGAGIKVGVVAVAVAAEYLILKRHPKMARLFTRLNYANSIFTGAVAARNLTR